MALAPVAIPINLTRIIIIVVDVVLALIEAITTSDIEVNRKHKMQNERYYQI